MKKILLTSAAFISLAVTAFSQGSAIKRSLFIPDLSRGLEYELKGAYTRPVTRERLAASAAISDVVPGYPVNWISSYVSVEVLTTSQGKPRKAVSSTPLLSAAQKDILKSADPGTDVEINVKYAYRDPVTREVTHNGMHVVMTVVPYAEAEYTGGREPMKKYLKEQVVNKVSGILPEEFRTASVLFTVNEKGQVSRARLVKSTTDAKADKLLLEAIYKMPAWKPAQNAGGQKVEQEFEFILGAPFTGGC